MKSSTLFALAIKITGLVALWHFIQSAPTLFAGIGLVTSMFSNFGGGQGGFMAVVGLTMFLNIFLAGIFAYLCLLKTDKMLIFFKFNNDETIDLKTNKNVLFDVAVFIAAILLLINGLNGFVTYDYKTDTNQTSAFNQQTNSFENSTSQVNSQTKHVNYFSMIQILMGLIFIIKGSSVSDWLIARYGQQESLAELSAKNSDFKLD